MPFSFSFNLSAPGLSNPFAAQVAVRSIPKQAEAPISIAENQPPAVHRDRRRPSPFSAPIEPLRRKRGWEPSCPEPSLPATMSASGTGYLDTPSKYREQAEAQREVEDDAMAAELPPTKRRRGLTGSIISTALSAAVIGTAVGLTVYRLWRDRGKEPEQTPPPPYQEAWVDARLPEQRSEQKSTALAPPPTPTRHRRTRSSAIATRRHNHPRRAQHYAPTGSVGRGRTAGLLTPPASNFDNDAQGEGTSEADADDQMDWFSDKLNKLIEEGKRALGTEVVVMSETQEDEVDDGTGDWVEEEYSTSRASSSIRRTRRRPGNLDLFPSSAHSSTFQSGSLSGRTDRSPLANPQSPLFHDDINNMSTELRESMEKARSAYNQRRGLGLNSQ